MKLRLAIDLDLTLGEAVIHPTSNAVLAFRQRPGCGALLERLHERYVLCLWSISSRWYVERVLGFGLGKYFDETYSWDELPGTWKDVRRIDAAYLIDDNPHYREAALQEGLDGSRYLVVPSCGSSADVADPTLWVRHIEEVLLQH